MQLVAYWRIIKRRLWVPLLLLIIVLISYPLLASSPPTAYSANMRFVVGLRPEAGLGERYQYDRYYTWLTAEYLLDDLAEVVKSHAFAQDVAEASGIAVGAGTIQGATAAGKLHRILSISITWHDPDQLTAIANGVVQVMEHQAGRYFGQLGTEQATISLIDPPSIVPIGISTRQRLDFPLRLVLALSAGIGIAFLLDYIDGTIRDQADLQELDLAILAQVPRKSPTLLGLRLRNRMR